MSLTYDDIKSGEIWKAKHLDEMLGGGSIVNFGDISENHDFERYRFWSPGSIATRDSYSLLRDGSRTMAKLYDSIVDCYFGVYGDCDVYYDSSRDCGMLRLDFDVPYIASHYDRLNDFNCVGTVFYSIPTSSIEAFRSEKEAYANNYHEFFDRLPLSLSDGTVVDVVRIFDSSPEVVYTSLCAFSPEYPRDNYVEQETPFEVTDLSGWGTGDMYDVDLYDEGFMSGGIIRIEFSDSLRIINDVLDSERQSKVELIPELSDAVTSSLSHENDRMFDL